MADGDAFFFAFESGFEAFQGFGVGFAAESEGCVVDRDNVFGAGVIGHADGLFGIAVGVDPRVVGADGHAGEFEGAFAFDFGEAFAESGVAAEDDLFAAAAEDVAVETAIGVVTPARAPVADLEGFDFDVAMVGCFDDGFFAPLEFGGVGEASAFKEVGITVGNDGFGAGLEFAQGAGVGVVEVRVGEENEVDAREFFGGKRRGDAAFGADDADAEVSAATGMENGIRQDVQAVEIDEDAGVAEPGGGDVGVFPIRGRGFGGRFPDVDADFGNAFANEFRCPALGKSDPRSAAGGGGTPGEFKKATTGNVLVDYRRFGLLFV